MTGFVICPRCGGKAFRNAKGKLLAHTTPATGGTRVERNGWSGLLQPIYSTPYVHAEVCE